MACYGIAAIHSSLMKPTSQVPIKRVSYYDGPGGNIAILRLFILASSKGDLYTYTIVSNETIHIIRLPFSHNNINEEKYLV